MSRDLSTCTMSVDQYLVRSHCLGPALPMSDNLRRITLSRPGSSLGPGRCILLCVSQQSSLPPSIAACVPGPAPPAATSALNNLQLATYILLFLDLSQFLGCHLQLLEPRCALAPGFVWWEFSKNFLVWKLEYYSVSHGIVQGHSTSSPKYGQSDF